MSIYKEFDSIKNLRISLIKKKINVIELFESLLSFIKNDKFNTFLSVDPKLVIKDAVKIYYEMKFDLYKPLSGIPIAHKDNIITNKNRNTSGSIILSNYMSPFNASIINILKNSGAISLGKLNCDEFAMGSDNYNSSFGSVINPKNFTSSTGGSSGGSAAAISAGYIMGATGTDTGGSIRQPASLCGVSSIRPTYGTVSRLGLISFSSNLDQIGIIAKNINDLIELLDPIVSFDKCESTSIKSLKFSKNYSGRIRFDFNYLNHFLKRKSILPFLGLKIGIPIEFFNFKIDKEILKNIYSALKIYENLGAELLSVSLKSTEFVTPVYYIISSVESYSNLHRYNGIRYGMFKSRGKNITEMINTSKKEGFGSELKSRILFGKYIISKDYYKSHYLQSKIMKKLISDDFKKTFSKCNIIISPVTKIVSRNIKKIKKDLDLNSDIFSLGASISGLPSVSINCGFSDKYSFKMPIGISIIGNYFSEGLILSMSKYFQKVTGIY